MKKWIAALIALVIVCRAVPGARAADYRYSQYCLRGLRDQFNLDTSYPEYAQECSDGEEFRGNIDDPDLYQYAGMAYVEGKSPTAINWELQPLIKYLYGVASKVGADPLLIQYLFFAVLSFALYATGRAMGMPTLISLLPVGLFFQDGLMREQLSRTYLDLGMTTFIILFLFLLTRSLTAKKNFVGAMVVLGCAALSKSFSLGIVVGVVGILGTYLLNKKRLRGYLTSLSIAVVTYIAGYTVFFMTHNPLDFMKLHIDILRFYRSYLPEYPKGEIFRVLFAGQWRIWFDHKGYQPVTEWSLMWPISFLASIMATARRYTARNPLLLMHGLWVIVYLLFATLRLVFPRYLVPVLPSMYLLLTCVLYQECYSLCNGWRYRHNLQSKRH